MATQIFFYFHPELWGRFPNLPNIFQWGWFNHQPGFFVLQETIHTANHHLKGDFGNTPRKQQRVSTWKLMIHWLEDYIFFGGGENCIFSTNLGGWWIRWNRDTAEIGKEMDGSFGSMDVYIYICVDVLHIVMYTSMHISMYIGMYIGMYISMNIYVFIYICVYICKRQDMPPPATGW